MGGRPLSATRLALGRIVAGTWRGVAWNDVGIHASPLRSVGVRKPLPAPSRDPGIESRQHALNTGNLAEDDPPVVEDAAAHAIGRRLVRLVFAGAVRVIAVRQYRGRFIERQAPIVQQSDRG